MKAKVLVADDEPEIRKIVRRVLESEGYDVLEADDGDTALEVFQKDKPDLVLLDLHMPRLDGLAALTEILDARPDALVIVFSGDGDGEHAHRALERGACDYIAKPLDMRQLKTAVEMCLLARS